MKSKSRIQTALEHREPDRVPLDLGGTAVTGIAASAVHDLKEVLGLSRPGKGTKVVDPYQMLGGNTDIPA